MLRVLLIIGVAVLSVCGGLLFLSLFVTLLLTTGRGFIVFHGPPKWQTILFMLLTLLPFIAAVYFLNRKNDHVLINAILLPFISSFILGFIWEVS
ncbi:hypothetical protein [Saccharibacillus sacchari]|uniref:Uncharacterized protein n=1 Tax=Saccharibacillus sacchari TaxID=456493 RepID=A0ACC6P972_9BACL